MLLSNDESRIKSKKKNKEKKRGASLKTSQRELRKSKWRETKYKRE